MLRLAKAALEDYSSLVAQDVIIAACGFRIPSVFLRSHALSTAGAMH